MSKYPINGFILNLWLILCLSLSPPTRNDVVQETMFRSLKVADDTKMYHYPVTYDLAVALNAYSFQSLKALLFDRLIILFGYFHVELAFFGVVGTYISDSGLEYLLTVGLDKSYLFFLKW